MHMLCSGSTHTHTNIDTRTTLHSRGNSGLVQPSFLKPAFLRSLRSSCSEICHQTDDATACSEFPDPCPPLVDHPPLNRPGGFHDPLLHSRTSRPGETILEIFFRLSLNTATLAHELNAVNCCLRVPFEWF